MSHKRNAEAAASQSQASSPPVSPEQWASWAELIANGELEFPANWPASIARRLGREIRNRRQRRLIRFIARAIARAIWCERPRSKEEFHAEI